MRSAKEFSLKQPTFTRKGKQRAPERRKIARTQVRLQVFFATRDEFVAAFTVDLGVGGLFIATEQLLAAGERLYLQFNLPGTDRLIEAEAEVRWTKTDGQTPGMGVRFLAMQQADFIELAAYMVGILGTLAGRPALSISDPLPEGQRSIAANCSDPTVE